MEQQKLEDRKLTVGDGIVGMLNAFVDPKGLAARVPAPLSWLWPLIVLCVIYVVFGYLMMPYTMAYIDLRMSQQNMPPEQLERARTITHAVYQFLPAATPVIVIAVFALLAWLVGLMGSIAGVRAKFRDIFSLMANCALIQGLQVIAAYIVIRSKGEEITSQEQLTPALGLDIFFPNLHGTLLTVLNYFSIFQVWYLVVLTIGLAYLAKTTKGKAFFAITIAWLVPLLLRVVQTMFQGAAGN